MAFPDYPGHEAKFIQADLGGVAVATAFPPAGRMRGTILYDVGGDVAYVLANDPPGVAVWKSFNGSGASSSWAKYVVNDSAIPLTPYTTILAAYNAAVADGHNEADPAVILVMPGTYAAGFSITVGGIYVLGWATEALEDIVVASHAVTVTGILDISLAAAGSTGLANLGIVGQLTLGGAAFQQVTLQGVTVLSEGLIAVAFTNTSGGGNNSELECRRCRFESTNVAAGARAFSSSGVRHRIVTAQTIFEVPATATSAIVIGDDVIHVVDGIVTGRIEVTLSGFATFERMRVDAYTGKSVASITGSLDDDARCFFYACRIFGDFTPMFTGANGLYTVSESNVNGPMTFASTVGTLTERDFQAFEYAAPLVGAGPFTLTNNLDTVYIDLDGVASQIILADVEETHDGAEVTIKVIDVGVGGSLFLTVDGGGLIDGASAYPVIMQDGTFPAITLRCRAGTGGDWTVTSRSFGPGSALTGTFAQQPAATGSLVGTRFLTTDTLEQFEIVNPTTIRLVGYDRYVPIDASDIIVWKMNEAAGATTIVNYGSAGAAGNGTAVGGATTGQSGLFGNGVRVEGATDGARQGIVSADGDATLRPAGSDLTVSLWLDPQILTNTNAVVSLWNRSYWAANVWLAPNNSVAAQVQLGILRFIVTRSLVAQTVVVPMPRQLPTEQWDLLTMTYDGTTLLGYLNDRLIVSNVFASAVTDQWGQDGAWGVGAIMNTGQATPFGADAYLCDFRVASVVRTPAEIANRYRRGVGIYQP